MILAGTAPTEAELRDLERKYLALADLRRRRDEGGAPGPARATLVGLARGFPGCLRELDCLGLAELERRASAAGAAASGAASVELWMPLIIAYHATLRAALAVKRELARRTPAGVAAAQATWSDFHHGLLAEVASRIAGRPLGAGFVRALLRPPEGRIGVVVLRDLAAHLGVDARSISDALFPVRRPSPYRL